VNKNSWKFCFSAGLLLVVGCCLLIVNSCGSRAPGPSGYSWTSINSGTTEPLNAVYVIDENHVWAVGANSTILFYDGNSWEAHPQSGGVLPGMHLWGLYAANQNHIWAVGDMLSILFCNGTSWEVQYITGANDALFTVTGTDENHVYTPMTGGLMKYFDGTNWSDWQQISSESGDPYQYFCNKIAACNNKIWIAAAQGTIGSNVGVILYYNGQHWDIPYPYDLGQSLCSVAAADENHVWAGGNCGGIFFSSGEAWTSQESEVETDFLHIRHMKALNRNEVWAVGDPPSSGEVGTILKYDGTKWNKLNCGVSEHFFGVDTYDGSKIWVVGDHGTIVLGRKE
jgi:hypothetical protein